MELTNLLSTTLDIGFLMAIPGCNKQQGPAETAGDQKRNDEKRNDEKSIDEKK